MNTEEKNNLEETSGKPIQNENPSKFTAKLIAFLKNNKTATVLAILLLIVFIWFSFKIRLNNKNFNNQKTQLITKYESKIDSLQIKHIEFASKVFSWSVRSELLRNNKENLNQLLTVFVQQSGVDLAQVINPTDKMVLISSDKKFENKPYNGNLNLQNENSVIQQEQGTIKIITPVMGFNKNIGILIVEYKNK